MNYYLFARLPHMPPTWTLAVLAVSAADARRHVRATWRGGSLVATVASGKIAADCGAITDAAAEETHRRMDEWHAETQHMIAAGELAAI